MSDFLSLDFLLLVLFSSICLMLSIVLFPIWKLLTIIYILIGIFVPIFVDFYIHSSEELKEK